MPKRMTYKTIREEMRPKDLNKLIGVLKAHETGMKQAKRGKEMKMMKPIMKWLCLQKVFQRFMKDSKEEKEHHEATNFCLMAQDVKVPYFSYYHS